MSFWGAWGIGQPSGADPALGNLGAWISALPRRLGSSAAPASCRGALISCFYSAEAASVTQKQQPAAAASAADAPGAMRIKEELNFAA